MSRFFSLRMKRNNGSLSYYVPRYSNKFFSQFPVIPFFFLLNLIAAYPSFKDEDLSADDADGIVARIAFVGYIVPLWRSPSMSKPRCGSHCRRCCRRRPCRVMSMGFVRPIVGFLRVTTRLSRSSVVRIVIWPGRSRPPRPIRRRRRRCRSRRGWRLRFLRWQWTTWYIAPQFAFRSA